MHNNIMQAVHSQDSIQMHREINLRRPICCEEKCKVVSRLRFLSFPQCRFLASYTKVDELLLMLYLRQSSDDLNFSTWS